MIVPCGTSDVTGDLEDDYILGATLQKICDPAESRIYDVAEDESETPCRTPLKSREEWRRSGSSYRHTSGNIIND